MSNIQFELLAKVKELMNARGFKRTAFFDDLLHAVMNASLGELQRVQPLFRELSDPEGRRSDNERYCDGMTYMLDALVDRRIEELEEIEQAKLEIEPGSMEHQAMKMIDRCTVHWVIELADELSIDKVSLLEELLLKLERAKIVHWTRAPSIISLTDKGYEKLDELNKAAPASA